MISIRLREALEAKRKQERQEEIYGELETLLEMMKENPQISRQEMRDKTGWSKVKINNRIERLREKGIIEIEKYYKITI